MFNEHCSSTETDKHVHVSCPFWLVVSPKENDHGWKLAFVERKDYYRLVIGPLQYCKCHSFQYAREGVQKKGKSSVRLTERVDPPTFDQLFVKTFDKRYEKFELSKK